jgi:malonyl-CoA/methylmalonyl-CoA synthetase
MSNVTYILTEPNTIQQVALIKEYADHIKTIQVERGTRCEFASDSNPEIDENLSIDAHRPCMVITTSGSSTGQPKFVVAPRRTFFYCGKTDPDRVFLAFRAVHWMGGATGLIARLLRGMRIHWPRRPWKPAMFWEIFKQGAITDVSFSSLLFKRLEEYYLVSIRGLPADEHDAYVSGARKIRAGTISGSTIDPMTAQFWMELTGMKIRNVYGSTELGGMALASDLDAPYVDVGYTWIIAPLTPYTLLTCPEVHWYACYWGADQTIKWR